MTGQQATVAQQLYNAGEHTVAQIAKMFGIPCSTVYGDSDRDRRESKAIKPSASETAAR